MQFQTYLFFDGKCGEAMRFYEHVLGGKIDMMMKYSESPEGCEQMPPGSGDRIMHASLTVDGALLMASDTPGGQPPEGMKGFSVSLNYPTPAAAKAVFDALAEGGKVGMPLGKTFFAETFGMVTDRFGTPWMVGGGAYAK